LKQVEIRICREACPALSVALIRNLGKNKMPDCRLLRQIRVLLLWDKDAPCHLKKIAVYYLKNAK